MKLPGSKRIVNKKRSPSNDTTAGSPIWVGFSGILGNGKLPRFWQRSKPPSGPRWLDGLRPLSGRGYNESDDLLLGGEHTSQAQRWNGFDSVGVRVAWKVPLAWVPSL